MTEDEKELLREAVKLLHTGTCNSLIPMIYETWRNDRDRVVRALREMAR